MKILIGVSSPKTIKEVSDILYSNRLKNSYTVNLSVFLKLSISAQEDCLKYGIMDREKDIEYTKIALKELIDDNTSNVRLCNFLRFLLDNKEIKISDLCELGKELKEIENKNGIVTLLLSNLKTFEKNYTHRTNITLHNYLMLFEIISKIDRQSLLRKIINSIIEYEENLETA